MDWPEKVKKMQSDWIGKAYGAEVDFKVDGRDRSLLQFTQQDLIHYTEQHLWYWHLSMHWHKSLAKEETREAVEQYIYRASTKFKYRQYAG